MLSDKLKEYLDEESVKYKSITHSAAFTAQQVAESAHISGKKMAKTVIVNLDGKNAMVVLPAPENIDLELLKSATGAKNVRFATESEFKSQFSECQTGAMPPFGNLYHMDVYVEESLTQDEEIAFNACSHNELLEISYKDYAQIVNPKIVRVSTLYSLSTV